MKFSYRSFTYIFTVPSALYLSRSCDLSRFNLLEKNLSTMRYNLRDSQSNVYKLCAFYFRIYLFHYYSHAFPEDFIQFKTIFITTIQYTAHSILHCISSNTDNIENIYIYVLFFNSVNVLYEKAF